MTVIDVSIQGDVTFRGEVVGKQYIAGVFVVQNIPVEGEVVVLDKLLGGARSKWAGLYSVVKVNEYCANGFSEPMTSVLVKPVEE